MDAIFQRLIDDKFSELAGLRLDASIPVPERLINEFVGMAIRGNKNIRYCRVAIGGGSRVAVNLKTPLWPWPLELQLILERLVDLRGSPKIRAKLENKVLLGRLGSFLKVLPEGILIRGDQVTIDGGVFLESQQKQLLSLVRTAEIRTEEGKLILDIHVEVP